MMMMVMRNPAEQVSGTEKMNTDSQQNKAEQLKRSCTDCHTTRTPLWRGGPSGPGSLCNACGIRYRKQRRGALLGLGQGRGEKSEKKMKRRRRGSSEIDVSVKLNLMGLGRDMVLQKKKLGEEEEAAILLMALSSGYVYA